MGHCFKMVHSITFPSLMASAVGADRFWQIDLGCHESEYMNEGPLSDQRPFLFSVLLLDFTGSVRVS